MATLAFTLRTDRLDRRGRAQVRIRISHRGTRRYVPTGVNVQPDRWSGKRQRVQSSHPESSSINARLAEIEGQASRALTRLEASRGRVTAERVREAVENQLFGSGEEEGPRCFLKFAREELEGYKRRGQYGTHKAYRSVVRKFEEYYEAEVGRDELPFEEVTPALIRRFRTYCYEVRKNNANTTGKALNIIRTFVRAAMKDGHISRADYPFEHITIDSEPVQKELLTPEEIEKIEKLPLPELSTIAEVRRWFLWAYYTGGMRFSDVATLQRQHIRNGRVYYRMEKVDEAAGVPLVEPAKEILRHYDDRPDHPKAWVFPILDGVDPKDRAEVVRIKESRNAIANKYLQKMADQAKLKKKVSFHLSRNAAAWRLYKAIGDLYKVSRFLGHSSVQQTEQYLEGFEDDSLDEDFRSAF